MNYLVIPTLLLALGFFGLGVLLARRARSDVSFCLLVIPAIAAAVPGVSFAAYYLKIFGEAIWLYELRSLPFIELTASGAGFLAGLLHGRYSAELRARRIATPLLFPGVLVIGIIIPYAKPILRPPQWSQFQDRWSDGVCLQTSESSCGPACAATLLRQMGKQTTEKDIARESLTSRSGTENWYLARTLRHRGIRVRFSLQGHDDKPWPFPSIAGVRLLNAGESGHFIAVLGRVDDKYIIADPLEGRLVLSRSALQADYAFTGLFMLLE